MHARPIFDSGERTTASVNVLHVARGEAAFDDLRLVELTPIEESAVAEVATALGEESHEGVPLMRNILATRPHFGHLNSLGLPHELQFDGISTYCCRSADMPVVMAAHLHL